MNMPADKISFPQNILEWAKDNQTHWTSQVIEAWDADKLDKLSPFIKSHYWSDRHSVNVFSVVGTAHPDYIGLTWLDFLHQGKRMRANQALLGRNPIYYDETTVKAPSMLYVSLNGKHWYVNGDGNHRTCIAKFHFERLNAQGISTQTMVHGVTTDDYRIDWDLYYLFESLKTLLDNTKTNGRLEPVREHLVRQDGPGWKVDKYATKLRYIQNQKEELLDRKGAEQLAKRLGKKADGLFNRLFSK